MNRAVFLDRDGTLAHDPGYLRDPAQVRLIDGAVEALAALTRAGFHLVVVTNQSGIARGLLTAADLESVHAEIARQLAPHEVRIAAWLHCPHHPDDGCACRKPGTVLHRQAAATLGLDLEASWCIGDRLGDLQPADALGARAVLVRTGEGARHEQAAREAGYPVVEDLSAAAALVLRG